ncbi:MAG: hypothetical protein ABIH49_03605 [archaeon]
MARRCVGEVGFVEISARRRSKKMGLFNGMRTTIYFPEPVTFSGYNPVSVLRVEVLPHNLRNFPFWRASLINRARKSEIERRYFNYFGRRSFNGNSEGISLEEWQEYARRFYEETVNDIASSYENGRDIPSGLFTRVLNSMT